MFCIKCGEAISEGSTLCPKCGAILNNENEGNVNCIASQISDNNLETKSDNDKADVGNKKKIKIVVFSILAVIAIIYFYNYIQASALQKELLRDWSTIEGSNGVYIDRILDFSEDEIEYRVETGYAWMDTTIATLPYKVISGNKIKVNSIEDKWEKITVEFDEEKEMMILSPGITSMDDRELWFNFE